MRAAMALRGGRQFLILQRPGEILSKDDPLALPAWAARFEMAGAGIKGIAHLAPETIARCYGDRERASWRSSTSRRC